MAIPGLYGFVQVCGFMLCLRFPLVNMFVASRCFSFDFLGFTEVIVIVIPYVR